MPEAKTVWLPFVENFRISPGAASNLSSATRRLPEGSKAIPRGLLWSVANVLSVVSGANTKIASPPGPPSFPSVVTQRFPDRSKARRRRRRPPQCSTQRAGIASPHAEGDELSGVIRDGEVNAFISGPAAFVGGVPLTRARNPWAMPEASA